MRNWHILSCVIRAADSKFMLRTCSETRPRTHDPEQSRVSLKCDLSDFVPPTWHLVYENQCTVTAVETLSRPLSFIKIRNVWNAVTLEEWTAAFLTENIRARVVYFLLIFFFMQPWVAPFNLCCLDNLSWIVWSPNRTCFEFAKAGGCGGLTLSRITLWGASRGSLRETWNSWN